MHVSILFISKKNIVQNFKFNKHKYNRLLILIIITLSIIIIVCTYKMLHRPKDLYSDLSPLCPPPALSFYYSHSLIASLMILQLENK